MAHVNMPSPLSLLWTFLSVTRDGMHGRIPGRQIAIEAYRRVIVKGWTSRSIRVSTTRAP